jgi:catechol 2,3-dioxygenase-like lactoylglutathione lyase family enzyme
MAGRNTRIGLWKPQVGVANGRGGIHVHFAMHDDQSDYRSAVDRLESQGLEVQEEDFEETESKACYITDPDGNVFELWTWEVARHLADS